MVDMYRTKVTKVVINQLIPGHHIVLMSGWWLSHPSEKYEFVSWDYEIPN